MAKPIIMPRQGQSVETCIITEWHKQKGDQVEVGDLLFSYETDKASFEEEAEETGILLEIFFDADDEVPVLTTIGVIGSPGEDFSDLVPKATKEETTETNTETNTKAEPQQTQTKMQSDSLPEKISQTAAPDNGLKISPRAKNLAIKHNLDYRYAQASGPEGRIIERDIQVLLDKGPQVTSAARSEYLDQASSRAGTGVGGRITTKDLAQDAKPTTGKTKQAVPTVEYIDQPLSNIRKRIGQTMHASLINTAQLTLNASFDATAILAYRKQLKAKQEDLGLENITINDLVTFAVAKTLVAYPELNAHLLENTLRTFTNVHLGIAVDTERGLMVPTVFNANLKSLNELTQTTKQVITQAQSGSINPDELQGGTFTVTNLGTLGIESFTPILNPPQTGILGVCGIEYKQRPNNGGYETYPAMSLSLTIDHRAVDGAPAAKFLQELRHNLENFSLLLAK